MNRPELLFLIGIYSCTHFTDSCTSSLKVDVPKCIINSNSFTWIQTEKFLAKPEITTSIKLKSNVLDHNFQTTLRKDLELVKAFGKIIFANFFLYLWKADLQKEDHVQLVQDQRILLIGPAWYKNDYILRV